MLFVHYGVLYAVELLGVILQRFILTLCVSLFYCLINQKHTFQQYKEAFLSIRNRSKKMVRKVKNTGQSLPGLRDSSRGPERQGVRRSAEPLLR